MKFKTPEDQICPICTDTRRTICNGIHCSECHFNSDNGIPPECNNACKEHDLIDIIYYYKTLYQVQKEKNMYLEYLLFLKEKKIERIYNIINIK